MAELERIRSEYSRRAQDPDLQKLYSSFHAHVQFATQTRERAILRLLQEAGLDLVIGSCALSWPPSHLLFPSEKAAKRDSRSHIDDGKIQGQADNTGAGVSEPADQCEGIEQ